MANKKKSQKKNSDKVAGQKRDANRFKYQSFKRTSWKRREKIVERTKKKKKEINRSYRATFSWLRNVERQNYQFCFIIGLLCFASFLRGGQAKECIVVMLHTYIYISTYIYIFFSIRKNAPSCLILCFSLLTITSAITIQACSLVLIILFYFFLFFLSHNFHDYSPFILTTGCSVYICYHLFTISFEIILQHLTTTRSGIFFFCIFFSFYFPVLLFLSLRHFSSAFFVYSQFVFITIIIFHPLPPPLFLKQNALSLLSLMVFFLRLTIYFLSHLRCQLFEFPYIVMNVWFIF